MNMTVRKSDQPSDRQGEHWAWCFDNGFISSEVADAVRVDTDLGTLTVECWLPVSQPGDPDFPELRRDEFNRPLTETRVLPLRVAVPDWMVTEIVGRLAA